MRRACRSRGSIGTPKLPGSTPHNTGFGDPTRPLASLGAVLPWFRSLRQHRLRGRQRKEDGPRLPDRWPTTRPTAIGMLLAAASATCSGDFFVLGSHCPRVPKSPSPGVAGETWGGMEKLRVSSSPSTGAPGL